MLIEEAALGDIKITGGSVFSNAAGIVISSAVPRVDIDNVRFEGNGGTNPINLTVVGQNVRIGRGNNYGSSAVAVPAAGPNLTAPQVASAATVALPPNAEESVIVTGTTAIANLTGGWMGRRITLIFGGALTVTSSTGFTFSMRLSGSANFAVSALGTLTLAHNGNQWFETGRSA